MCCFSCQNTSSASFLHSVQADLCCFWQMQQWWHASRSTYYKKCLLLAKAIICSLCITLLIDPCLYNVARLFSFWEKKKLESLAAISDGCTCINKCLGNIASNNLISEVKPFSWMSSRVKCHDESPLIWFHLTTGTHKIDFSPFGDGIFWLKICSEKIISLMVNPQTCPSEVHQST